MNRIWAVLSACVLVCGSAWADGGGGGGGGGGAVQGQNQSAQQKQFQSQSNEGIGNSSSVSGSSSKSLSNAKSSADNLNVVMPEQETNVKITSNVEQNTPPISLMFPQSPFLFPSERQVELWNAPPFADLNDYEGVVTMKQVDYILSQAEEKGPFEGLASLFCGGAQNGFGFKGLVTAHKKLPPTKEIRVVFVGSPEKLEGYSKLGDGNFMGDENRTFELTLAYALKSAMKKGASLAVFTGGMNGVNHGNSAGGAAGAAGAAVANSYSVLGGLYSSDATVRGESVIRMRVYYKNGGNVSTGKSTKDVSVQAPPGVDVSKEILKKAAEDGNWGWSRTAK